MGNNEFEFVDGIRVLPAGFDVEKAERAIDFFLNTSTSRTYMTFRTLAERYLTLYVTLYSGSTSGWCLCKLLGVDPGERATLKTGVKEELLRGSKIVRRRIKQKNAEVSEVD